MFYLIGSLLSDPSVDMPITATPTDQYSGSAISMSYDVSRSVLNERKQY